MVDGVTSVGAVDLKLRKLDLDALVFGSQKALALPPGLAIVCVSPSAHGEGGQGQEPRLLPGPDPVQEDGRQGPSADHAAGVADVRSGLPAGQDAQGGRAEAVRSAPAHGRHGARLGDEAPRPLRRGRLPFQHHHRDKLERLDFKEFDKGSGKRDLRYRPDTAT